MSVDRESVEAEVGADHRPFGDALNGSDDARVSGEEALAGGQGDVRDATRAAIREKLDALARSARGAQDSMRGFGDTAHVPLGAVERKDRHDPNRRTVNGRTEVVRPGWFLIGSWITRAGKRSKTHAFNAVEGMGPMVTVCGRVARERPRYPSSHPLSQALEAPLFEVVLATPDMHAWGVLDKCLRCGVTRKAMIEMDFVPLCVPTSCVLCSEQLMIRFEESAAYSRSARAMLEKAEATRWY